MTRHTWRFARTHHHVCQMYFGNIECINGNLIRLVCQPVLETPTVSRWHTTITRNYASFSSIIKLDIIIITSRMEEVVYKDVAESMLYVCCEYFLFNYCVLFLVERACNCLRSIWISFFYVVSVPENCVVILLRNGWIINMVELWRIFSSNSVQITMW